MDQKFCNQLINGQKKTCSPLLSGQKFITYIFLDEFHKKEEEGEIMHPKGQEGPIISSRTSWL
jgi:hypothetical protein